jgi:hypothetical protein
MNTTNRFPNPDQAVITPDEEGPKNVPFWWLKLRHRNNHLGSGSAQASSPFTQSKAALLRLAAVTRNRRKKILYPTIWVDHSLGPLLVSAHLNHHHGYGSDGVLRSAL